MLAIQHSKSECHEYLYHEAENYHEFIAFESTRRVIEVYMALTEELTIKMMVGELPESPIRVLIDLTHSGMLPLQMLYVVYKKYLDKYPNAPVGRIAYLTRETGRDALIGGSVGTVANYSHSHKNNVRKFFAGNEREQALAWLLSDE
jgi:hypothetical protein